MRSTGIWSIKPADMNFQCFTGGDLETNCFLLAAPGGDVLIDAPEGCADWLAREGRRVGMLLLTHGHFDHVMDAARVVREHKCRTGYHADGIRMLTEPGFFRKMGFPWDVEPVAADFLIEEGADQNFLGAEFQVLHVPGHCVGSLCFYHVPSKLLFGGDVLFAGAIGRWDLPGGNLDQLLSGIRNKVLPLGDEVTVWPGHGPSTTVGRERRTNPFLA